MSESVLINATSDKSVFDVHFKPPIDLIGRKKLIAFYSLELNNAIPNITKKNNTFKYQVNNKWVTFKFPIGLYLFNDLSRLIKGRTGAIMVANHATLKAALETKQSGIDFNVDNSIAPVLGFEKKMIPANTQICGDDLIKIFDLNTIHINCSCVVGSYVNGKQSNTIYTFYPNEGPGEKIVKEARNMIFLPIAGSSTQEIVDMKISITDQNNIPLDFRGEIISLTLQLI